VAAPALRRRVLSGGIGAAALEARLGELATKLDAGSEIDLTPDIDMPKLVADLKRGDPDAMAQLEMMHRRDPEGAYDLLKKELTPHEFDRLVVQMGPPNLPEEFPARRDLAARSRADGEFVGRTLADLRSGAKENQKNYSREEYADRVRQAYADLEGSIKAGASGEAGAVVAKGKAYVDVEIGVALGAKGEWKDGDKTANSGALKDLSEQVSNAKRELESTIRTATEQEDQYGAAYKQATAAERHFEVARTAIAGRLGK
jgi:hypothetical protein